MPRFSYTAKSLKGLPKQGELEAKNEREVAKILRREGYILISAKSKEKPTRKEMSLFLFSRKVSLVEKIMFTRNLKVMIASGVSLPRALETLSQQTRSRKFKKVLSGMSQEIVKGENFSYAIAKYPSVFSELFSSMVKVGEEAGTLEEVLGILSKQMERENELRSKIKGAMIYPAVIVGAMTVIGLIMLIVVVPKLAQTFDELGIELPLTTRLVVSFGSFLADYWYFMPLIIIFILFLFRISLKTKAGKIIIDTFLLKVPLINPIVRKTNSAYTVRTLSSLIASGVSIVRSLEITSGVLKNIYYKKAILDAMEQVRKGNKLAEALGGYKDIYPPLVIQMVAVGEETGKTSEILEKLADFFEEEITNLTKNLSSVIEPILMLIIGAVVGFFAISMIQPIYSMIGAL